MALTTKGLIGWCLAGGAAVGAVSLLALRSAAKSTPLVPSVAPDATPEQIRLALDEEAAARAADAETARVRLVACRNELANADTRLAILGGAVGLAPLSSVALGAIGTVAPAAALGGMAGLVADRLRGGR